MADRVSVWCPLLMVALLSSCTLFSRLPAAMPADFTMSVEQSGGMLPYSVHTTYSPLGGRYQKSYLYQGQDLTCDFRFATPPGALDALYQDLAANGFDRITTHQEEIYDRGGFQLSVHTKGETFTVIDGGRSVVDAFWLPNWKAIAKRLTAFEDAMLQQYGARVTFRLSPEVRNLPELYIGLDLQPVLHHDETSSERAEVTVFPGTYALVLGAGQTAQYNTQVVSIDGPRTFDVVLDGKSIQAK